jgi:fatty acid desaturase
MNPMHDPIDIDYDAIRQRVTEKTQRRYRFMAHTIIFFLGLPLFGGLTPLVFVVWVLAWAFHFLWISYHQSLEAELEQAYDAERERIAKLKRAGDFQPLGLGDDGEFIHYDDDSSDGYQSYRG